MGPAPLRRSNGIRDATTEPITSTTQGCLNPYTYRLFRGADESRCVQGVRTDHDQFKYSAADRAKGLNGKCPLGI